MTNTDEAPMPEQQPVEQTPTAEPEIHETPESRLETARRFLQDAAVRDAPRGKKVEFLKSKEITDDEIESLLGPQESEPGEISISRTPDHHEEPRSREQQQELHQVQAQEQEQEQEQPIEQPPSHTDRPPIITYPEYLTPPARAPPLLTANAVLTTLYAATGLSTLLYGTKTFLVDPMLFSLTQARLDLHATTSANLAALSEKLESTVSEVPSPPAVTHRQQQNEDEDSECEDPSELFHRDVGTQTTEPYSPPYPRAATTTGQGREDQNQEPATQVQTRRLAALMRNLSDLRDGLDGQADDMRGILSAVDTFRDDLRESSVAKSYASLGWRQPEPDDEIKRAKENIRRLKGVFLSTRNFPLSTK